MLIGQKVIELREKKGWSQQDLAAETHLSNATISRLEKGLLKSPEKYLRQLTDALGVDEMEILGIEIPAENKTEIRIGFVFSLLAAPLAYYQLKRRKSLTGIRLTSFGLKIDSLDSKDTVKKMNELVFYSRAEKPDEFSYHKYKKTHSSKSLLNWLDQEALDCAFMSTKKVENKKAYKHIAKITDSSVKAAKLLICHFDDEPIEQKRKQETLTVVKNNVDVAKWIHKQRLVEEEAFASYLFREDNIAFNAFYKKILFSEIEHQIHTNSNSKIVELLKDSMSDVSVLSFDYNKFCKQIKKKNESEYKNIISIVAVKLTRIQLFYNEPSVAKELFDTYMLDDHYLDINPNLLFFEDREKWKEKIQLAMFPFVFEKTNELLTDFRRSVIFLSWQPKVSHLKREISRFLDDRKISSFSLELFSLYETYGSVAFAFDAAYSYGIIAKNSNIIYSSVFLNFLRELQDCIYEIQDAQTSLMDEERDTLSELNRLKVEKTDLESLLGGAEDKMKKENLEKVRGFYSEQIDNYKKGIEKIEKEHNEAMLKFSNIVRSNEVIKTIAQAFRMSPYNCYDSIKNLEFGLDCDLSWVLSLNKKLVNKY